MCSDVYINGTMGTYTEFWFIQDKDMYDVSNSMCYTEYVAEKLMFGLLFNGRSLYMDNF